MDIKNTNGVGNIAGGILNGSMLGQKVTVYKMDIKADNFNPDAQKTAGLVPIFPLGQTPIVPLACDGLLEGTSGSAHKTFTITQGSAAYAAKILKAMYNGTQD